MRLHVVSLPHTQLTKAYSACAYTQKVLKFCDMMVARGHDVTVYASEDNESAAHLVPCITKKEQSRFGFRGSEDYLKIDFNQTQPWHSFNTNVIREMGKRLEKNDIICVITGYPAKAIADAFVNIAVEFGVGYSGVCLPFRVFESHAWRNYVYGQLRADGAFFDEVIPNYFDTEAFPVSATKEDYFLYIGRLTEKKGWHIAQEVCERLGKRLVVAGPGEFSGYGEYVGTVGPELRGTLMSRAKAVFVPTLYIPPFEGVHIEANLCGTPVITTDFGVFTETVQQGINGWRCKMFYEFVEAVHAAETVSKVQYQHIATRARHLYSLETVAAQYERYFERLQTLQADGWYTMRPAYA